MTLPAVRIKGYPTEFTAFVALHHYADEVRVRHNAHRRTKTWKCDNCGPNQKPTCAHQQVAHQYTQETDTP